MIPTEGLNEPLWIGGKPYRTQRLSQAMAQIMSWWDELQKTLARMERTHLHTHHQPG